jgi:hypothetical protein
VLPLVRGGSNGCRRCVSVRWGRISAAAKWLTRPLSARMPRRADGLLVGLVRVLLVSAKHLFLAAKQWQFVPASGVRWDRVSAAKADTVPICTTGVPGCRRLLVALFPVRVLFWSAKHLFHG